MTAISACLRDWPAYNCDALAAVHFAALEARGAGVPSDGLTPKILSLHLGKLPWKTRVAAEAFLTKPEYYVAWIGDDPAAGAAAIATQLPGDLAVDSPEIVEIPSDSVVRPEVQAEESLDRSNVKRFRPDTSLENEQVALGDGISPNAKATVLAVSPLLPPLLDENPDPGPEFDYDFYRDSLLNRSPHFELPQVDPFAFLDQRSSEASCASRRTSRNPPL